jgi:hypothetical protein
MLFITRKAPSNTWEYVRTRRPYLRALTETPDKRDPPITTNFVRDRGFCRWRAIEIPTETTQKSISRSGGPGNSFLNCFSWKLYSSSATKTTIPDKSGRHWGSLLLGVSLRALSKNAKALPQKLQSHNLIDGSHERVKGASFSDAFSGRINPEGDTYLRLE